MIIYKLTTPNNKCWIGQSKTTLKKRLVQHIQVWKKLKRRKESYRNSCAKLFCAFDNFNPEIEGNWTNEVIFEPTSHKEMDEKEIHFIEFYDSIANGYNITMGGQGVKKEFLDDIQKQNISVARTAYYQTEEGKKWLQIHSENLKGNSYFGAEKPNLTKTEKQKQKQSDSMKGKIPWNKGLTGIYSEETLESNRQKALKRHAKGEYDYKAMAEMRKGFKQPQSQKDGVAKALAKEYDFINPQGDHIHIVNLLKFCRENGLNQANMLKVHQEKIHSNKEWKKFK